MDRLSAVLSLALISMSSLVALADSETPDRRNERQIMADNEAIAKYTCEAAVRERLVVPETYKRVSASVELTPMTESRLRSTLKITDPVKLAAAISDFHSGKRFGVTDAFVLLDYEATNKQAAIVKSRSYCKIRIDNKTGKVPLDIMEVDGMYKMGDIWVPKKTK